MATIALYLVYVGYSSTRTFLRKIPLLGQLPKDLKLLILDFVEFEGCELIDKIPQQLQIY